MTIGHFRRAVGRHIPSERQKEIMEKHIQLHEKQVKNLVPCQGKKLKVAIVGGGFAGLYTAYLLSKLNFKVTVFESLDRLGGRVHSLDHFSKCRIVEAGAEYIGLNHGAWLALASKFGLGMIDVSSDTKLSKALKLQPNVVLNGKKLSPEKATALTQEMNEVFDRIAIESKKIQYPNAPWLEPPEIQALDRISTGEMLDRWGVKGEVRELFDVFYTNDNAGSAYKSSYLGDLCAVKGGSIDGKTEEFYDIYQLFKCASGNQALAEELAKHTEGKIYLKTRVQKIRYNGKTFKVATSQGKHIFDRVVVSTPPSVWKYIEFSPQFSSKKYKPSLGPAIKYLTTVKERFWVQEGISPNGLNDVIGEIWEASENQSWVPGQGINLTVFAGGKYADIALAKNKKKSQKIYNKELDKSFEGAFSPNLRYSEFYNHPELPTIKTGYSFMGVGKATTVAKRDNFPLPEFDNKLFLAGEYTSTSFYGYMEGALQSALRVATQLSN